MIGQYVRMIAAPNTRIGLSKLPVSIATTPAFYSIKTHELYSRFLIFGCESSSLRSVGRQRTTRWQ